MLKMLLDLILGSKPSSGEKSLSLSDYWSALRDVLTAALAVGGIHALELIDGIDFGAYDEIVSAVAMYLLVIARRYQKNYEPEEEEG